MNSKHLAGVLALSLLIPGHCAFAQTAPPTSPTEQQRKAKKELEQKALVMLSEVIKDGQSFRTAENQLRVKAIAASLLWKYDEPRARILFKETMSGIVDLLNNQDEADASASRVLQAATQLRREVVQMLASRDARMARELMRATRQAIARSANGRNVDPDAELQLEYSLATQITETDPKQALEIAEENLSRGYAYELLNTLKTLQAKDREAAAKLTGDIMSKLRAENLATNHEAINMVYGLFDIVFNTSGDGDNKETPKTEPLLDAQGMRDLMEMNVNLALNMPNNSSRLEVLGGMMPQVEKYAPARAPELRRRMAQGKSAGEKEINGLPPEWEKYQAVMEKGSGEQLAAAAAKAPRGGLRDSLYQAAAMKYVAEGDAEHARDIINNHISDSSTRNRLLAELERQSSLTAAEQGKMEQVRKSLANLRSNEERALLLAQIAGALTAKGEKKLARQLLGEAQSMVNYRARNARQMAAQLMVAQAYVKLEPERSLTMLEPLVDQLNELLAAAVTLGGFLFDEDMMREDEIPLDMLMEMLSSSAGAYTPDLRTLASFDFDRTRALADRFQRDEVRIMARLLVVQSVLGEEATPENPGNRAPTTVTVTVAPATPASQDAKTDDGAP